MNRLPSNPVGRVVIVLLANGSELVGECVGVRYENDGGGHIILHVNSWNYTVEAEEITAIGVNREGEE